MKKKQKSYAEPDKVILQIVPPKQNGGQNAKSDEVRKNFLFAYEENCGNITKSCKYAGINRLTFYRWMQSDSPVNVEFQEQLRLLKPVEKLLDLAETALIDKVKEGNIRAIIYVLDRLGSSRGYVEKSNHTEHRLIRLAVERIIKTIELLKSTRPAYQPDIEGFIELAAEDYEVSRELVKQEFERRFGDAKRTRINDNSNQ